MGPRPLFSAFGIPVSIDPFFLFGAFLVFSWTGGGQRGLFTVIALVVFVVVHEFGHALTAQAFGARTTITISFLGGFASYVPTRTMTTRHRLAISLMGPLTQFVVALPVLWFVLDRYTSAMASADFSNARLYLNMVQAVAWGGIFIAFLNLLPFWPFDGGHIAEGLLRRAFGARATRVFLIASIAAGVLMGAMYLFARTSPDAPIFGALSGDVTPDFTVLNTVWIELRSLPGLVFGETLFIPLIVVMASFGQLQQLDRSMARVKVENAPTGRQMAHEEAVRATRHAERESWITGRLGQFPSGWSPSPWVQAHALLLANRPTDAAAALRNLGDDHRRNWLLDRPDRPELDHLLPYVPADVADSLAVLEVRVHHGSPEDLVAHATQRFIDEQSAEPLYLGAEGLAARGLLDEAMQWLHRAVSVGPDPQRMATSRELRPLHSRSEFQQLLGAAERAAAASRG
ncbi:MAG: M50 family metallopeptidase [Acidimicrobiales bacterium]